MRSGTIAFLAGILLLSQLPRLPAFIPVLLLFPVGVCIFSPSTVVRLTAIFLVGFLWAWLRADLVLQQQLPDVLEGKTLEVTGRVVSLPEKRPGRTRFEFIIEKIHNAEGNRHTIQGKVRLNWYRSRANIKPGQVWRLFVRLKRPYGFMNPGGFDYEMWLFLKRIRATGYVLQADNHFTGKSRGQWINRARYELRQAIHYATRECRHCGLLTALGLGDRSLLDTGQKNILVRTGTSHLLAISGLHIGLVATLVFLCVRRLWGLGGVLPVYASSLHAAVVAALVAAGLYALLAGFTIPTQRALVMVSIVMLSLLSARRYPLTLVLGLALLTVLCLDPFAVLDAGFWLSFSAVAIIVYGMSCRYGAGNLFWRWGRVQLLVAVGLAPLLLSWFQQVSLVGIPANLLAVPWISLIVVPLTLPGTLLTIIHPEIAGMFLGLADRALSLLWPCLEMMAASKYAVWQHTSPPFWVLFTSLGGIFILLQPRGLPARWVGACWLAPLLWPQQTVPAAGDMWLTLLDVGQGLSAVVQTREHVMVYDTGARFSDTFNAGDAVVVPFLRQTGTGQPDLLLVSHSDNDHIGGARAVIRAFPGVPVYGNTGPVVMPDPVYPCHDRQNWQWDGVQFVILHPPPDHDYSNNNNRSCVLKVTAGKRSLLLTGDIEHEVERRLLQKYAKQLQSDVLVVPHHGSTTSSTQMFVKTVQADWALVAAGYRNRFKLPNRDIIERYQRNNSKVLNTARHGAIQVRFTRSGELTVEWYRHAARRFWHSDQANLSVKREFD